MFVIVASLLFIALLSGYLSAQVRNLSIKHAHLDIPNDRSSHQIPTPKGGGIAIIVSFLSAMVIYQVAVFSHIIHWPVPINQLLAVFSIAAILATVGWYDDRFNMSASKRALIQMLSASLALYLMLLNSGTPYFLQNNSITNVLIVFVLLGWVVGFINMYNFIDGIDGLVAGQSVVAAFFIALWFFMEDFIGLGLISLALAMASLGFLYWNIAPAKLFMGDVGSTALGGVFAILAVPLILKDPIYFFVYPLLFSVFIADASITLIKRIIRGERFWEAHRQHFYQQAAMKYGSHGKVSGTINGIGLIIGLILTIVIWLSH